MAYPRQHLLKAAGVVAGPTRRRAYKQFLPGLLPGQGDEWPCDSEWLTKIETMGENHCPPVR
jgi:hypothetical protein